MARPALHRIRLLAFGSLLVVAVTGCRNFPHPGTLVSVANGWNHPVTVRYGRDDGSTITDQLEPCRTSTRGLDPGTYVVEVSALATSRQSLAVAPAPPERAYNIEIQADGSVAFGVEIASPAASSGCASSAEGTGPAGLA